MIAIGSILAEPAKNVGELFFFFPPHRSPLDDSEMSIEANPDLVVINSDTDEWSNEKSLQHAYALYLEEQGYEVDLEVTIYIGGERKRIDIMARDDDGEVLMIEAKPKLSGSAAYQACGQLNAYSTVTYADRRIVLVGIAEDDGAIATVEQSGMELFVYDPEDDRRLRVGENEDESESAYVASYSYSSDYNLDFSETGGGCFIVAIVVAVLGLIGGLVGDGGSGQPLQPGGIQAGSPLTVTPRGGNCQPLRLQPTNKSQIIGCVNSGTALTATSDELKSGWIRVTGSANGDGWIWYDGVSIDN